MHFQEKWLPVFRSKMPVLRQPMKMRGGSKCLEPPFSLVGQNGISKGCGFETGFDSLFSDY